MAFAAIFFFSALYIVFIEGTQNWQALWTSGAYVLLGLAMIGVRSKEAIVQPEPSAVADEMALPSARL